MITINLYFQKEDKSENNIEPDKTRLMKMCAPEWPYILVGAIAAIIMGLFTPIYGIVFGDILGVSITPILIYFNSLKMYIPIYNIM